MTNQENSSELSVDYRLKSMVMARILAELTVFLILLALPLVAFLQGWFASMEQAWIIVLCVLSLFSAVMIPVYGFITWRVRVTQTGLITRSLFQSQTRNWQSIKGISRRSNFNWQRYVVESEDGNIVFPIWLKDVDKLVLTIKSRLPQGVGLPSPFRRFSQDPISLVFQIGQAFMGIALTIIFWVFFVQLSSDQVTNKADMIILLFFCLALTVCILWRTLIILLMPRCIQLTEAFMRVETLFFSREYAWDEIKKVTESIPLLPEGFVIKTGRQTYLIGSGMDAADELLATVRKKIPDEITKKNKT